MQPKIYPLEEHQIPLEKVDAQAYYVIQKLRQAGYSAYLVGGSVRDLLLGETPKDFDISTSAKPEEIKALFRNCILIGRRFRLAHIRFGKKVIEVSTFRSGDIENSDLILRDNNFGSEEQDVLRRDFTINGLFYDPEEQTVIDYVGGYADLKQNILRTIGQPEIRFRQDPVRMIRLIKFHSRFQLYIDPSTLNALKTCREDIIKSSQARILEELMRMLESGSSALFFQNLHSYGLLHLLLPKLAEYLTETGEKNPVYELLHHIDAHKKEKKKALERPLLAICLIYPLFEKKILHKKTTENLHLGQISEKAKGIIDHLFLPFFHLSRRMKSTMSFLMTCQFRFVLEDASKKPRIRIPKDADFPLALRFFKIRAHLNPHLLEIYEIWYQEMEKKKASFTPKKGKSRGASSRRKVSRNRSRE